LQHENAEARKEVATAEARKEVDIYIIYLRLFLLVKYGAKIFSQKKVMRVQS
jgi:hypothetical protein